MAASINGLLERLSAKYYIPAQSYEAKKIDRSVATIKDNLKSYFGKNLTNVKEFGSYKRDTILPAYYDYYSDVDLMVVLNRQNFNVTPATYLEHLRGFAKKYYGRSTSKRTSPSFTIELEHIAYDLVPAYEEQSFFNILPTTLLIPQGSNSWQVTDPDSFNEKVSKINGQYNYLIKPTIRLLKAWNAKVGYPYGGYQLEKIIIEQTSIYSFNLTLEKLFFHVIDNLTSHTLLSFTSSLENSLRENANKVKQALQLDNQEQAERWLKHILPIP